MYSVRERFLLLLYQLFRLMGRYYESLRTTQPQARLEISQVNMQRVTGFEDLIRCRISRQQGSELSLELLRILLDQLERCMHIGPVLLPLLRRLGMETTT